MKNTTLFLLLSLLQPISQANIFKANNHFNQKHVSGFLNHFLSVANINNDGIDDLIISTSSDQGLVIYLGQANGEFEQLFTTPIIGPIEGSVVFDFDSDGDDDIWISPLNYEDERNVVLVNNGAGLFSKVVISTDDNYEFRYIKDILFGDIDSDGDVDLIKIVQDSSGFNSENVAEFFINDGTGDFQLRDNETSLLQFSELVDFNGDGYLDLVTADNNLKVFINNQSGLFPDIPESYELGFPLFNCDGIPEQDSMLFEDIDNDGDMDIQLLSKSTGLRRVINNGDGSFTSSGDSSCIPTDVSGFITIDNRPVPQGLFVDVNQDGVKDLWLGYDSNKNSTVNLSMANGNMSNEYLELNNASVLSLVKGNFNQDNKEEVVALGSNGLVAWVMNNQDTFTQVNLEKINQSWGGIVSALADDINHDNIVDLIYVQNNHIYSRAGNGAGAFAQPVKLVESNMGKLLTIDLDGNDLKDFIGLGNTGNGTSLFMHLQNEPGLFSTQEMFLSESSSYPLSSVHSSDFDGDGDKDLMAIVDSAIFIYENRGESNFEQIQLIGDIWYSAADFIDLNNQERSAFLSYGVGNFSNGTQEVYQEWLWNGSQFELTRSTSANRQETAIVTFDYDADGDLDILSTTRIDNDHYLLVINETDHFVHDKYAYAGDALAFAEDINNDDLVDYIDRNGSIYLNNGAGEHILVQDSDEISGIIDLVDFDGDGDLDILARDWGLVTYLNQTNNFEMSGLWFNPEQSGHGLSLEQIQVNETPNVLFSWFAVHENEPLWLIGLAPIEAGRAEISVEFTSGTGFGSGFNGGEVEHHVWGSVVLEQQDMNNLSVEWHPEIEGFESGQMSMQRLTSIKAAAAQPYMLNSCHSGSWFNSTQSGHGLFIQVVQVEQQDTLVVSWYHYFNNKQFWMVGQGPIEGRFATVSLYSGSKGLFPPHYNQADANIQFWGDLSFELLSDATARISWQTEAPGFENGELMLEKLTALDRYQCQQ